MLVEFRQPAVMRMLANAGLDWVIIDNEHGPFSIESVAELSRAARGVGLTPIVRVPVITYEQIAPAMDGGAQGIMLPRVRSVADVKAGLEAMKYPPAGRRGGVLARGHTDFQGGDLVEAMRSANEESFLIVQVETREALDRLDEILAMPGLDAALIGPTDLSIALGVPGQIRAPALEAAIERTVAACRKYGVHPAIHTNDIALTAEWAKRGMHLVSINSEAGFLMRAGQEAVAAMRQAEKGRG